MRVIAGFSRGSRALIVLAAATIVISCLKAASSFITPILLAVFIAVVATPPLRWMRRRGLPKWVALAIVIFVLLDIGSILALFMTGALEGFRNGLPGYQERYVLLTEQLGSWLEDVGMAGSREAVPDIFDPAVATAVVRSILSNVSGIFATGLLVLLILLFLLLEAAGFPDKLKAAFHLSEKAEIRLRRLLRSINRYMMLKSMTSLMTGFCVWMWLSFLGIDFAILWSGLAFFFNFVPFIGAVLMAIPAILIALLQAGLQTMLLVVLGYLVINTMIGSILEPRLMGRGLGMSALAVLLSLLFWGWVFGTVGVFLSVPLTMALMIAFEASPDTRPLVVLLGPDVTSKPTAPDDQDSAGLTTD